MPRCLSWFLAVCMLVLGSVAAAQTTEAVPWEGASDVELPPFLQDTEKRVVDERPPPTVARNVSPVFW